MQGASNTLKAHGQTPSAHSNISILEVSIIISRGYNSFGSFSMEKQGLPGDALVVSAESFFEIKDALRKTLHVMIDLDFEDGKLDGAINCFLVAKKFQISLTFNLNPNDVILIRNLTKNKMTADVLDNIRKARYGQS